MTAWHSCPQMRETFAELHSSMPALSLQWCLCTSVCSEGLRTVASHSAS